MTKKNFTFRYKRVVSLSKLIPKITRSISSEKAGIYTKLLLYWDEILGAEWCLKIYPLKLTHTGTLHLIVRPRDVLSVQYASQMIIHRLNHYLGKPSIKKLFYLQQDKLPTLRLREVFKPSCIQQPASIAKTTSQIKTSFDLEGVPQEVAHALSQFEKSLHTRSA